MDLRGKHAAVPVARLDWVPTGEAGPVALADAGCGSDPAACLRSLVGPRPLHAPAVAGTGWVTQQHSVARVPVHHWSWNSTDSAANLTATVQSLGSVGYVIWEHRHPAPAVQAHQRTDSGQGVEGEVVRESCSRGLEVSAVPDWAPDRPSAERCPEMELPGDHGEQEAATGGFQSFLHDFAGIADSWVEKIFGLPGRKRQGQRHRAGLQGLGTVDAGGTHGRICAKPHHRRGYFSRRTS